MDRKQYDLFMDTVTNYLKASGAPPYKIDDGVVLFTEGAALGFEQMGLLNLAQVCAGSEPEEYPERVAVHFESFKKSADLFKSLDDDVKDFDKIKDYLGLRLQGGDYTEKVNDRAVFRKIAEDLYAHLVFDLPDTIRSVHPDEAAAWDAPEDDIFELAKANIRRNYVSEKRWVEFKESGFWMIFGDNFFVPNIILDLEENEDLLGPQGAIVGAPHRHTALILPIRTLEVMAVIGGLMPALSKMHEEGPGSISPQMYWYKDGRFVTLPYVVKDDKIEFHSPEVFTEMLNELPKPGDAAIKN
ncbi:hypothetical protein LJB99_04255 [Deltaproteobacteria bacterium OttesenSCG-928-K17]|nr:hypothetical protein [Deltaproteobacteria bacterium OttesenSCG-928-K17]